MIEAMISGKLIMQPQEGKASNGNPYIKCLVACPQDNADPQVVSVICFDAESVESVGRMSKGDAISLVGKVTLSLYAAKDGQQRVGVQMVATRSMSVYQARKIRTPVEKPV